jgi:hypothetical protein
MMKKLIAVVCTLSKTINEFEKKPVFKSLEKLHKLYPDFDVAIVKDNKKGLSEVYNSFLTEEYKNNILLFIHDDLEINDLFLLEKLNN